MHRDILKLVQKKFLYVKKWKRLHLNIRKTRTIFSLKNIFARDMVRKKCGYYMCLQFDRLQEQV